MARKPLPKHWYYIVTHYCPVCSRTDTFRERRKGRRPERWEDRHEFHEVFDQCVL